jgi:hypothetical protein
MHVIDVMWTCGTTVGIQRLHTFLSFMNQRMLAAGFEAAEVQLTSTKSPAL